MKRQTKKALKISLILSSIVAVIYLLSSYVHTSLNISDLAFYGILAVITSFILTFVGIKLGRWKK